MEVSSVSPPEAENRETSGGSGPWRRRAQILGWTLIWTGVFIFGYLAWEVWGTDLINSQVQAEAAESLDVTLDDARRRLPPVVEVDVDEAPTIEHFPEEAPAEGTALGMLRVPSLGLEVVVFEGVDTETLQSGPGHMPGTAFPGQPGNAVISGHRTTYGSPFFDFDLLVPGDRIEIETAIGAHVYEVRESFIVEPTDVWVTDDKPGGWLTFTTCNPKFSARERLIVTAQLVDGPNLEYVEVLEERMSQLN
ncbi:MAG: sortase [Acidimicrobiia bacterium]